MRLWYMFQWHLLAAVLFVVVGANVEPKSRIEGIANVTMCQETEKVNRVCLRIHLNSSLFTDGSRIGLVCKLYDHPQHTPEHIDMAWFATATSTHCKDGDKVCQLRIHQLLPDSTYYAFCSGWWNDHFFKVWPNCPSTEPSCGVRVQTVDQKGAPHCTTTHFASSLLIVVYIVWSFLFDRVHILHETGVAVLVGLAAGYVVQSATGETVMFSYDTFNLFLLPMVIFSAGFNLRKRNFFRYSTYIVSFGLIGTVVTFVLIFFISRAWLSDHVDYAGQRITLTPRQLLIMAAVLASTDTVAPIAFLPAEAFPRLFAVVFGEGVLNDVVSILLSSAAAESSELPDTFSLCTNLLYFFGTSFAVGIAFGLATTLLFRYAPPLRSGSLKPCALVILLNYLCYVFSDMVAISAVFALFVSAVVSGHYASHWLDDKTRGFTQEVAEILSYCAEAFVFGYFGLTAVHHLCKGSFCVNVILIYLSSVFIARFATIALITLVLWLLRCCHDLSLTVRELMVVSLAGCMRGTIAYALIVRALPATLNAVQETMVSTILFIVLANAIFTGGLFPLVLKVLGITARAAEADELAAALAQVEVPCSTSAESLTRTLQALPRQRSLPNVMNPRNHMHGAWHHIDNVYFKPFLRPRRQETHPGSARSCRTLQGGLVEAEAIATPTDAPVHRQHLSDINEQQEHNPGQAQPASELDAGH
mmetsp:Transcript_39453/g.108681  ORF Transcript_39453/g.108681 Transcript_39453/m.108681 type:complete len:702 (+) Transcript_39453:52-2157(+)